MGSPGGIPSGENPTLSAMYYAYILRSLRDGSYYYGSPEAERYASESLSLSDSLEFEKGLVFVKWHLAQIAYKQEKYREAIELYEECIKLFADLDLKIY